LFPMFPNRAKLQGKARPRKMENKVGSYKP